MRMFINIPGQHLKPYEGPIPQIGSHMDIRESDDERSYHVVQFVRYSCSRYEHKDPVEPVEVTISLSRQYR